MDLRRRAQNRVVKHRARHQAPPRGAASDVDEHNDGSGAHRPEPLPGAKSEPKQPDPRHSAEVSLRQHKPQKAAQSRLHRRAWHRRGRSAQRVLPADHQGVVRPELRHVHAERAETHVLVQRHVRGVQHQL